ncbi:branched-chain amino acid aminotransferase [Pseudochelatococcus contaminans]|uniref:Branched-chain-amino-acid aminotransferase n=1 Tax=Pseudochelatococcus contaminans TaxID=1538103 RepID=A0A7W5Z331_9HYPH|nr:branched-chain amino acid aminotransferase [Pseudochelatococcus contaminans]MBB3808935.1 branched-chain amino acid aminotransferase [Pseudochelatococcus contaminans]
MSVSPQENKKDVIWIDGKLVPREEANIPVLTHGLHYASAVFEGERAYNGVIFKSRQHSERLLNSGRQLDFEIPFTAEEIDAAKELVLKENGLVDAYIRPIAWRGAEALGVSAQKNSIHLAIAAWVWPSYFTREERMKGIRLAFARYRRPDPATAPSTAKAAALYSIATISKHEAERQGYSDALFLDWRGRVVECTGANIFFVKNGELHTPDPEGILNGITRQTVIELAKKRGIPVVERAILPEELSTFTESFVTGTAAEVTPVSEIGEHKFTPGEITTTLLNDYENLVQGK